MSGQRECAYSPESERSVLGGILVDADAILTASEYVRPEDFYRAEHRTILRAAVALREAGEPVDLVLLAERLRGSGDLEACGGAAYLAHLANEVPTASNIAFHAQRVQRFAALRALTDASRRILAEVEGAGNRSAEEVWGAAERIMEESTPALRGTPMQALKEELWPAMERLEKLGTPNEDPRIRTGVAAVDSLTGGFRRGDLVVVAGRPAMGKSAWGVCNVLGHAAIEEKCVCALFTVETRLADVTDRLLASYGRVNLHAARKRGGLRDEDYPRLAHASGVLNTAPIYMDHRTRTIDGARAKLRRLKRERGRVDLVMFDYLQLLEAPQFGVNRTQEVGYISRHLKYIAEEFDCVVVALAQLGRKVEERPDKRPVMSDLKESGNIEQDADVIMLLYRPEYYFGSTMKIGRGKDAKEVNVEGRAEIIIGKARDGDTGIAVAVFEKEFTRFADVGPKLYEG